MSRSSDKINIIDQNTYQILKKDNEAFTRKILHSAKYKNKHKQDKQCTLFDFLSVPQKKHKQGKQKRPFLIVARKSSILQPKRKGKTRLRPKRRVARLKRIIKNYRNWKHQIAKDKECLETVQNALELMSFGDKSAIQEASFGDKSANKEASFGNKSANQETSENLLPDQLHKLTLNETKVNTVKERHGLPPKRTEKHALTNVVANTRCPPQSDQLSSKSIHSRRFRSYCNNCTTTRLKEFTSNLLKDLDRFQKRAHAINEIKARAHPRFVVGFRESLSRLRINKVKLLLLAPDCEVCPIPGGLDDTIDDLKLVCQQQKIPYCFSLLRRELAYTLNKRGQISCVAILDYDGANETFKQLVQELDVARNQYKRLTAS